MGKKEHGYRKVTLFPLTLHQKICMSVKLGNKICFFKMIPVCMRLKKG